MLCAARAFWGVEEIRTSHVCVERTANNAVWLSDNMKMNDCCQRSLTDAWVASGGEDVARPLRSGGEHPGAVPGEHGHVEAAGGASEGLRAYRRGRAPQLSDAVVRGREHLATRRGGGRLT